MVDVACGVYWILKSQINRGRMRVIRDWLCRFKVICLKLHACTKFSALQHFSFLTILSENAHEKSLPGYWVPLQIKLIILEPTHKNNKFVQSYLQIHWSTIWWSEEPHDSSLDKVEGKRTRKGDKLSLGLNGAHRNIDRWFLGRIG